MRTRPEDQLKRMLEQTLIPPTTVTELDPDTIDATTSRIASLTGSLSEAYQFNSQHTHASFNRLPDAATRATVRKFYFETTLSAFTRLHRDGSRWSMHAQNLPPRFQQLLSPLWSNAAAVDAMYTVDVLLLAEGILWRSVPGAPGFISEKQWSDVQAGELQEAFPDRDLAASDGLLFVVGHLTRASYLTGDRAARSVGLAAGVVAGALFAAGASANSGISIQIVDAFIDALANRALGCDGVERSLAAVLTLSAESEEFSPPPPETDDATATDGVGALSGSTTDRAEDEAAGPGAEALAVAVRWEALPASGRDAVAEALDSATDVSESGQDPVLRRVAHRIFERSVQEFFGAEQSSTQLPADLVHHTLPDPLGIPLPTGDPDTEEASLAQVLAGRRVVRSYERGALALEELSTVLRLAAGSTDTEDGYGVRGIPKFPYPSIGGLDSNELGVIINNVSGIEPGYYVYDKVGHALSPRLKGDMRLSLVTATFESEWLFYAPAVLVLANDQQKVAWKYKTRGYRISHLDQGALLQNLSLVATAQGLGSCPVAGYFDEVLNRILGYTGQDKFVASLLALGRPNRLGHGG
ncbi:SagB/ThcOx family dehydrogenase [Arthrobacter sp. H35-D1]|uniref:SagB/ThcOx family dehydrogenase n=1 Tax=Arthrobacter sp. H35-D1 TaxID=3046202 RepID=UPI0024BAF4D7|nr:SagB/ThcOx family dehydrogenase [Arthrobacter sp. H35-D1]MDJ0312184.1 SagB/ThcOx family dehydrogenase [Arthrobacter sp. H35-D1]